MKTLNEYRTEFPHYHYPDPIHLAPTTITLKPNTDTEKIDIGYPLVQLEMKLRFKRWGENAIILSYNGRKGKTNRTSVLYKHIQGIHIEEKNLCFQE